MLERKRFKGRLRMYGMSINGGRLLLVLLLCIFTGTVISASAQNRTWTDREAKLKAVLLVNFLKYTDFPSGSHQEEVPLCVLGENVFGDFIFLADTKVARGRKIKVKLFDTFNDEIKNCGLLFITRTYKESYGEILGRLIEYPILTVAELEGFAEEGGIVGVYNLGTTTRFQVNLPQMRQQNIKLSSRVLSLADVITTSKVKLRE